MTSENKNIEELKAHLDPDETIDSYIFGAYNCIIENKDTLRDGILTATNKRLIFYSKKNLSFDMRKFSYSSILSIEISNDFMGHIIFIISPGNRLILKWINSRNIDEFINIMRERIYVKTKTPLEG